MKFQITLNDDDYLAWNIAWHIRPNKKLQCIMIRILGWIFLCLLAYSVLLKTLYQNFGISMLIDIVVIFYIVLFALNYPKRFVKKIVASLKKEGKLPYYEKSTVEFLADEFCESTDNSIENVKYEDITNILQDKEHIYLQIGALKGVILPIHCLNDQQQVLLDFLNNKLSKKNPYAPPKSSS